jgi:hypothetical protein
LQGTNNPQVVVLAAVRLTLLGYQFSHQFEQGQRWDGYAPGLATGLFGKRVVRKCTCPAIPCHMLWQLQLVAGQSSSWQHVPAGPF